MPNNKHNLQIILKFYSYTPVKVYYLAYHACFIAKRDSEMRKVVLPVVISMLSYVMMWLSKD